MASMFGIDISDFSPFWFILVMATGISSSILHEFPYEARWLRYCSYIMFALASVVYIALNVALVLHSSTLIRKEGFKKWFEYYFINMNNNLFWGAFCMGTFTIINYVYLIASHLPAGTSPAVLRHMIHAVYALWWIDLVLSLFCGWGILFCVFRYNRSEKDKFTAEGLQSVLLLPVLALVVAAGSGSLFGMSDLLVAYSSRNTQLVTLIVVLLVWLNALTLVFLVLSVYFWSLFVNRIPPQGKIFTVFICIGPCGQGAFGILLLADNFKKYIMLYHRGSEIVAQSAAAAFKVFGFVAGLALLSLGFFFTLFAVACVCSYSKQNIHVFHKGWIAMTFPLGTMALGSNQLYVQYKEYAPMSAFRVVSAIYSAATVLITCYCMLQFGCALLKAMRSTEPRLL